MKECHTSRSFSLSNWKINTRYFMETEPCFSTRIVHVITDLEAVDLPVAILWQRDEFELEAFLLRVGRKFVELAFTCQGQSSNKLKEIAHRRKIYWNNRGWIPEGTLLKPLRQFSWILPCAHNSTKQNESDAFVQLIQSLRPLWSRSALAVLFKCT